MTTKANSWFICGMILCLTMVFGSPDAKCQIKSKRTSGIAGNFEQERDAANKARDEGRDEDAIRSYQKSLALRPDWQEGRWYLSTLLYERERFPEARDELRRFVADEPQAGPGLGGAGNERVSDTRLSAFA